MGATFLCFDSNILTFEVDVWVVYPKHYLWFCRPWDVRKFFKNQIGFLYLSEQYPESFASWILGVAPTGIDILKTERSRWTYSCWFCSFAASSESNITLRISSERHNSSVLEGGCDERSTNVLRNYSRGKVRGSLAVYPTLINWRIGTVTLDLQLQVQNLTTSELEELGVALLDFRDASDLDGWLSNIDKWHFIIYCW